MIFVREASSAVVLVTLTLSLQCVGMAAVLAWARPSFAPDLVTLGPIRSAMLMNYFSAASYATVGYGDVVLPWMWRTLGPVESIIGVLMCGLSASFLFAIVSRLVDRETKLSPEPAKPHGAYIEGETIPTI